MKTKSITFSALLAMTLGMLHLTSQAAKAEEPAATAKASLNESGGNLGAEVNFRAQVAQPDKTHSYELYYQFRVHTKQGEMGPLLGTTENPQGKPIFVARKSGDAKFVNFDETVDITRGMLTGMSNLTPFDPSLKSYYFSLVRVEPQIYEVSQKKYLTPSKTSAVILVAYVGDNGKVLRLQPLGDLLIWAGTDGRHPTQYLKMLVSLDDYSSLDNKIEEASAAVLSSKTASPEAKLAFLQAMPTKHLGSKDVHALNVALTDLAQGSDAQLKAAAQKVLDGAKK